jgi:hypothetical protein
LATLNGEAHVPHEGNRINVEPAMSAAEWANREAFRRHLAAFWPIRRRADGVLEIQIDRGNTFELDSPHGLATLIASANDLLPGDDPRKVTRSTIDRLCWLLNVDCELSGESEELAQAHRFIEALESYLPPTAGRG